MDRDAYSNLLEWKTSPGRKPLIVRGVRQCGKTYLIRRFAEQEYSDHAYFSFENNSPLASVFARDMDVRRIINELGILRGRKIGPETAVIFDEIQFCATALASLKYFCEDAPEYHIICAGSLLGVRIAQIKRRGRAGVSFPVGKVSFLDLRPLNFHEFVVASGNSGLADLLSAIEPFDPLPESVEPLLRDLYLQYLAVGGMPEAVSTWFSERDMGTVRRVQGEILSGYRQDFSDYAPAPDIPKISAIWRSIPAQLSKENKKFMFGHAVSGSRASQMEDALYWLIDQGMIIKVPLANCPRIPLGETADNRTFKIYACDVGLLGYMADAEPGRILDGSADRLRGMLAENFVLNEIISAAGGTDRVFYWKNPKGRAEVDFIIRQGDGQIPIEVKSGRVNRLGSMEEYMSRFSPYSAVLVSEKNVRGGRLIHLPFWLVWRISEYCTSGEYTLDMAGRWLSGHRFLRIPEHLRGPCHTCPMAGVRPDPDLCCLQI